MALINSSTDGTGLIVDTTAKAARVLLYDAAGNVLVGQKTMAASVPVAIASDQAPVPISGTVSTTLSGTVLVDGSAHTQPVSGTVGVSGTVAVDGSAHTQPVSAAALPLPTGAATETTLAAASAKLPATIGQKTMAASLAVAIASDQGVVPVSATALPLPSGAATAAKQPALGTAGTPSSDVITVQGAAAGTAIKTDGSATTQPISATALPLPTGAATQATLAAISGQLPATLGQKTMAASQAVTIASDQGAVPVSDNGSSITIDGSISLGVATGKTIVGKPGSITSSAVTADQVVVTYTVTVGKTLYLQSWSWSVRLTTMAATATNFGTISLETPSGTKIYTDNLAAGAGAVPSLIYPPGEPIAIAAGTVIRIVVTPASTTSMVWTGNLLGYEK